MAAKSYNLKSSNLKSMTYDPKAQELHVTFHNGSTYKYVGVAPKIAWALRRNKSAGKTFNRRVRQGGFQYEKIAFLSGLLDGLEKIGWFGTYYHGTSPEASKSVLKEGLKTSKGGTGAAAVGADALEKLEFGSAPFVERSKGKIHMTPSKTHAKLYQAIMNPEIRKPLPERGWGRLKEVGRRVLKAATDQPLQIRGVPKEQLSQDLDDAWGVTHDKDIPVSQVQRATPTAQRAKSFVQRVGGLLGKRGRGI